jgi:hypothetical protein
VLKAFQIHPLGFSSYTQLLRLLQLEEVMQSREDEKKDQGAISRVLLIFVCTALSNSNGILLYNYQFEFHLNLDSLSFFARPDD